MALRTRCGRCLPPPLRPCHCARGLQDIPKKLMPARQRELIAECRSLQRRIYETLASTNGILIAPIHASVAPLHDVSLLRPWNVAYTQLFNVLETPCTAVPIGLDRDGLPVAVQLVGAHGFDHLTIAAAQALEHAGAAGWIPPAVVSTCPKCRTDAA